MGLASKIFLSSRVFSKRRVKMSIVNGSDDRQAVTASSILSPNNLYSLPSIEWLTDRVNRLTWKFAVETFLKLEDLWETVKPVPNSDVSHKRAEVSKSSHKNHVAAGSRKLHEKDARMARDA